MRATARLLAAALMAVGLGGAWAPAWAQTVALAGMLGGRALLIVNGQAPKTVAVGDSFQGVKVVSTQGDLAVVELAGKKHTLRVGDAPSSVGASSSAAGGEGGGTIVLTAGEGGHFFTQGQINGKSTRMVVDTGATSVSLSVAEAQRLGIDYQSGQGIRMSTANGVIPGWRVQLGAVRVGDVVVHGVDAIVSSGAMPFVLLGNSFLTRFQMTRTNDQMVLLKRY
jgi:aspartyl protease family protein